MVWQSRPCFEVVDQYGHALQTLCHCQRSASSPGQPEAGACPQWLKSDKTARAAYTYTSLLPYCCPNVVTYGNWLHCRKTRLRKILCRNKNSLTTTENSFIGRLSKVFHLLASGVGFRYHPPPPWRLVASHNHSPKCAMQLRPSVLS